MIAFWLADAFLAGTALGVTVMRWSRRRTH